MYVVRPSVDLFYDNTGVYEQVDAVQDHQVKAFSSGDSGGPVYAINSGSSSVTAYGMVVAQVVGSPYRGYYTRFNAIIGANAVFNSAQLVLK